MQYLSFKPLMKYCEKTKSNAKFTWSRNTWTFNFLIFHIDAQTRVYYIIVSSNAVCVNIQYGRTCWMHYAYRSHIIRRIRIRRQSENRKY